MPREATSAVRLDRVGTHWADAAGGECDLRSRVAESRRMVSRTSRERLRVERSKVRTLPVELPPGSTPIREVERRTGLNRVRALQLKSEGVIIHRTADYQFHVDEASLHAHLSKR